MTDHTDNEDEVGYGKPPKEHQFKKGVSGNPKGRPKGIRNFETELKEVVNSKVTVHRDGRKQSISVKHAALWKLTEKSLSGNIPALRTLVDLMRTYDEKEIDNAVAQLSQEDAELLEQFTKKIRDEVQKDSPDKEEKNEK